MCQNGNIHCDPLNKLLSQEKYSKYPCFKRTLYWQSQFPGIFALGLLQCETRNEHGYIIIIPPWNEVEPPALYLL